MLCALLDLDHNISPFKVCHEHPVNIRENTTFVVDIMKLHHENDALKDGLASGIIVAVPFHVMGM